MHVHDVFISYSRKDQPFARRLSKALRNYRPPKGVGGPQKYLNVFLDEEDFTGVEYRGSVGRHLGDSAKLMLLCSPHARRSQFVDDEVRRFADTNGADNIIPILVSGLPNNEATPEQSDQMAFPAALCERMEMPLAVDYRQFDPSKDKISAGSFQAPWYSTLANIYGTSRDQIEQREKRRAARRRRITAAIVGVVMTLLTTALIVSLVFWRQAVEQRTIAVARQLAAQAELVRNQQVDLLDLSFLLATESMKRSPSLEADLMVRPMLALFPHPVSRASFGEEVSAAVFSADGLYAANGAGGILKIWDLRTGREIRTLKPPDALSTIAFSPDRRHLASASGTMQFLFKEKVVVIWDLTTGAELARIAHKEPMNGVLFSPTGARLASWGGNEIIVSEAPSGRLVATLTPARTVMALAFSPDGRSIAASTNDGLLHRWNVASGEEAAPIRTGDMALALAFSPDGIRIATTGATTRVWEFATGAEVSRASYASSTAIAFSPGGGMVAAASDAGIIVSDAATGREHTRIAQKLVKDVVFSPDGSSIATAGWDDTFRIWSIEGREITRINDPLAWRVAFTADGTRFATASRLGVVGLWEATNGRELVAQQLEFDSAVPALSHGGRYVVAVGKDRVVRVRDSLTAQEVARIPSETQVETLAVGEGANPLLAIVGEKAVRIVELTTGRDVATLQADNITETLAFDARGQHLATIGRDNIVRVWDVRSRNPPVSLPHDDGVDTVMFSPDGARVVTGTINSDTIFVWEAATGRQVAHFKSEGSLTSLTFDSRGRFLVAAALQTDAVQIWDASDGWASTRVTHKGGVVAFAFSPDDTGFATAGLDFTVRLWRTSDRRELAQLRHEQVMGVGFSSDGSLLVTAGGDGKARMWDVSGGREVARLEHLSAVLMAAVSDDGRYLTTVSNNAIARTWFLRPADLVTEACARLTRNLTTEEWRQYVGDEPYRMTCPNLPGPQRRQ